MFEILDPTLSLIIFGSIISAFIEFAKWVQKKTKITWFTPKLIAGWTCLIIGVVYATYEGDGSAREWLNNAAFAATFAWGSAVGIYEAVKKSEKKEV